MPRVLAVVVALLALASPAQAGIGPDHVSSDGVTLVQNIRTPGAGMGGSLHGSRLFVTSPTHMTIFDVSSPEAPALESVTPLGEANEVEAVATNGKIAAVAEGECLDPAVRGRCIAVFDVTGEPQRLTSVPMSGSITAACIMDCRYVWVTGQNEILDMADPAAPKVIGTVVPDEVDLAGLCYTAREVRPGVAMVSCDPILTLSILPEHGGSPARPAVLGRAHTPDYSPMLVGGAPHSAHWPQAGADRFMLSTTETPFQAQCSEDLGAFVTWDASNAASMLPGSLFHRIDSWRPANGTYVDGRSPYNAVGCSPHWLGEHPTFRNGGLVAQAALENGLRFLQVTPEGQIEERGWFLGLGGTAAVPVWHPDGRTLYLVDYARGLDVLRYEGELYVGPAGPSTESTQPAAPPPPRPRFRVVGAGASRRGTASIAIEVPGAGRVTARPTAKRGRRTLALRTVTAKARQAGLVTLTIGATGRARAELRRRGRLPVTVRIAFKPAEGATRSATVRVTLRRR